MNAKNDVGAFMCPPWFQLLIQKSKIYHFFLEV